VTKYSLPWWAIKKRKAAKVYRPPGPPYLGPDPIVGSWMMGHE
jgi:hypothetical protein